MSEENPWVFRPPVFDWKDPRAPDDPCIADGTQLRFMVDRETRAVLDTSQPEFYYIPITPDLTISLSSFRVIHYMGSPRIMGVGEIDFEGDLFGIIGIPDSASHSISVSIYPTSYLGTHGSTAMLGYSGALEPDLGFSGSKEMWFAQAYIEDTALQKTIEVIERKPPQEIYVSLKLNNGAFRRMRLVSSFAGSSEDTYQIANYLCPKLDRRLDSPENAEGDAAQISIASETYVLKNSDGSASAEPQHEDPVAVALERLRGKIEQVGAYLVSILCALVIVWLLR